MMYLATDTVGSTAAMRGLCNGCPLVVTGSEDRTEYGLRPPSESRLSRWLAWHHRPVHWVLVLAATVLIIPLLPQHVSFESPAPKPAATPSSTVAAPAKSPPDPNHPPHGVKVWLAKYKGRTFRITQLPRCEHLETVFTYDPTGETLASARKRVGGIAGLSGSFHHPQSMYLADFFQIDGAVLSAATTGRAVVVVWPSGLLDITRDYAKVIRVPGVHGMALGQQLHPFTYDRFTKAFMNQVTDRMSIGINQRFIYIVQGKSDIWRLAAFYRDQLPVRIAVNSDGGHVVRGRAPVHIVFRWREKKAKPQIPGATPVVKPLTGRP